jgi:hypothetical protein
MVNGVSVDQVSIPKFGTIDSETPITVHLPVPSGATATFDCDTATAPQVGEFVKLVTGEYRYVTGVDINGLTASVSYAGTNVESNTAQRVQYTTNSSPGGVNQGDIMFWRGKDFYDLDPNDCVQFVYQSTQQPT